MVELVDTRGLGPRAARRGGSSPLGGTDKNVVTKGRSIFVCILEKMTRTESSLFIQERNDWL